MTIAIVLTSLRSLEYLHDTASGVQLYFSRSHLKPTTQLNRPKRRSACTGRRHKSDTKPSTSSLPKPKWGGYNPASHGSYDPNADYAREATKEEEEEEEEQV